MSAQNGRAQPAVPGVGRLHAWRVAVRIARRDAMRYKARSLMVLAMIAVPIIGVSAADVTIRSSQLTVAQEADRELGAADVRLTDGGDGPQPVYQEPHGGSLSVRQAEELAKGAGDSAVESNGESPPVDMTKALPPGARWITDDETYAPVMTKYGLLDVEVRELKADDPIARGITRLDKGRFPRTAGEMSATTAFLKSSGLHIGSQVKVRGLGRSYTIVGAYELPSELDTEQLDALPGAFIEPYKASPATSKDMWFAPSPSYLVSVEGDFTWDMVKHANTLGVLGDSRVVREHPPARADVPLYQVLPSYGKSQYGGDNGRAEAVAVGVTIVSLSMLEICLLAGPAFAVGARRSRRQLGLVGANGGDRRHVRAIVISSGLVIGVAAAVVGTLLGVALTEVLRGPLEGYVGKRFGGLRLEPLELAAIGGLAVLTGVLAAVVPAVAASRQSVLASLTGRRGVRRASRMLPTAGLFLLCLGVAVVFYATARADNIYTAVLGSGLAEIGLAMMTSVLVGLFGRLGRWLPVAPRLALRDAVRNRGRTAPAVAAVLAAVAGSVAVATYAASKSVEDRQSYQAELPRGAVAVSAYGDAQRDLGQVRAVVAKHYPVTGRVDVSRIYVGPPECATGDGAEKCGSVQPVMPEANKCPSSRQDIGPLTRAQADKLMTDWRCDRPGRPAAIGTEGGVLVGGPGVLHALGIRDGAAEQALARGETVLFDRAYADHGTFKIKLVADSTDVPEDGAEPKGPVKALPAYLSAQSQSYGVTAVVPQRAADAAGMTTTPAGSFFTTASMPTDAQRQALNEDVAKIGTRAQVYLERGYEGNGGVILLALTLFAGLITIGASGITTGLAQADAEPDLRTLAAIGAAGRLRRTLSGFQCAVVAAMGVVLGSIAGVLPAVALRRVEKRHQWNEYRRMLMAGWSDGSNVPHVPVAIPWETLALLVVGVPVGAGLLAALVTRSRPELGRRAEG